MIHTCQKIHRCSIENRLDSNTFIGREYKYKSEAVCYVDDNLGFNQLEEVVPSLTLLYNHNLRRGIWI